ncbi:hypothetical protein Psal073_03548 (plasmid) [Piscirickettsia salmonis]|uniref:Uncharacterized protein n=1 Tax=Piscirickettsia salmonis TaxID=1238 RepID=A0AAC9EUU5_PISSA|nr:hypothetical protein KU39_1276 [Piscirickettsia salmonis]QGO66899.1 hypothetical protein Psal073_01861 [Piscirickettsia salmonis]QGO68544.1 hypothetical protein Psal073_03548 [Piscirickettsia salmonis]QGO73934.1 hypothetical protein Psal098_01932 [Piscirickettsia salmonis]
MQAVNKCETAVVFYIVDFIYFFRLTLFWTNDKFRQLL